MILLKHVKPGPTCRFRGRNGWARLARFDVQRAPLLDFIELRCWSPRVKGTGNVPPAAIQIDTKTARRLHATLGQILDNERANTETSKVQGEAAETFGYPWEGDQEGSETTV